MFCGTSPLHRHTSTKNKHKNPISRLRCIEKKIVEENNTCKDTKILGLIIFLCGKSVAFGGLVHDLAAV
jgi:hypothetical protein